MTTTQVQKRVQIRLGIVTAAGRNKTVRVEMGYRVRHPKYGKYVRHRTILHVHDERNDAKVGDRVEVVPCRPISKTKHWRLLKVVQRGAGPVVEPIPGLPEFTAGQGETP